jgi:CRP/FNR family transcriptional regulator, anaerobic regulatory protein
MRSGLVAESFPFMANLAAKSRSELGVLRATRVPAGRRLLARGDPVGGAYFVVGGALRVYYLTPEGREATLYRVEPGGTCILALTASFADGRYPAWVDAGPAGAAFVRVPHETFRRLFDDEPSLREFVFGVLASRVFELMLTLEQTGSARLEQRLARHLVCQADTSGLVRQSQSSIAADLGTAREVVSRTLSGLSRRGLIRTGRAQISVLNAAALADLAGGADLSRR